MTLRNWLLLAVVAVFALPAFAQREIAPEEPPTGGGTTDVEWSGGLSFATGQYMENPCTAVQDWVWVSYGVDLYQQGWETLGDQRVLFDEQTTMDGSYATSGTSTSDVVYSMQPFTLRKYHKVDTTYDAFHVVTVIDFDPATRQSTISVETACGNGMPDSAQ